MGLLCFAFGMCTVPSKIGFMPDQNASTCDVLVVDDNPVQLFALARAIRTGGMTTVEVDTPFGVTKAVSRHRPKVVLLDVTMPALRGNDLVQFIRRADGAKGDAGGSPFGDGGCPATGASASMWRGCVDSQKCG